MKKITYYHLSKKNLLLKTLSVTLKTTLQLFIFETKPRICHTTSNTHTHTT